MRPESMMVQPVADFYTPDMGDDRPAEVNRIAICPDNHLGFVRICEFVRILDFPDKGHYLNPGVKHAVNSAICRGEIKGSSP